MGSRIAFLMNYLLSFGNHIIEFLNININYNKSKI